MKIGYTEFSFGYAFTENLIRSAPAGPTGAPFFPNLVQEAKLGYDIRIDLPGCPLFFQYKLPELMVRDTANEISQFCLPGMSAPFFRMPLMRRDLSQQHKLLIDQEKRYPDAVFYATPEIKNVTAFNTAYNAAQVHTKSVFFSPGEIGPLPDNKQHVVAYQNGLSHAWLCSEPRRISVFRVEDIKDRARRLFGDPRHHTLEVAATTIREELFAAVPQEIRASEDAIRHRIRNARSTLIGQPELDARTSNVVEEILVSREIARVGLGLEMLLAQPRK